MDVDTALSLVGGKRRYHIFLFCLGMAHQFLAISYHGFIVVFIGWEPTHYCKTNEEMINSSVANTLAYMNDNGSSNASLMEFPQYLTTDALKVKREFNSENSTLNVMKCHEYKSEIIEGFLKNDSIILRELIPCRNGWSYEGRGYLSIVEEWDLVCDKNYLAELTQIFFVIGSVIGDLFFSFLIDKYGRKTMIVATHIVICIIGVANAYSVSYLMFALLKIPLGLFCTLNLTAGTMASIELFSSKHRTTPGILMQIGFSLSCGSLVLLAYFIQNWRHLQLAVSLICGLSTLAGFITPESVPWLYYKGKFKEAEDVIRKMAKYNGVILEPGIKIFPSTNIVVLKKESFSKTLSSDDNHNNTNKSIDTNNLDFEIVVVKSSQVAGKELNMKGNNQTKLSVKDVLTDKILMKFIAILGFLWFTAYAGFQTILLSPSNLGRNRFINYLVIGILDIPMVILTTYLCNKIGRCLAMTGGLVIGGILSIIKAMLPSEIYGFDLFWIGLVLLLLAKECFGLVFAILILYTKELFPTQLRSTCNGICVFWGRLGNLLSPLSAYLLKTPYYWVPNITNGSLAILAGFTVFFLPETMGRTTPETIEDCHKLDLKSKAFKRCR